MTTVKDETWINFVAYKLRADYRVMPEASRFQLAAFLVEVLESPHDRVDVRSYSTVGVRADCDFFLRATAPSPEELQAFSVRVRNSGLGRYLDVTHTWMGRHDDDTPPAAAGVEGWMAVVPVTLCRRFLELGADERGALQTEYAEVGDRFVAVSHRTDRSFGSGEPETLMSCSGPDLGELEAMLRALRGTAMHRYLARPPTVLVGRTVTAFRALELCGAL